MEKNRSISIAKGIAIVLMVIGHTHFSTYGKNFIYMFHMPLFFFFSGYCFKDKYLDDTKGFALRRIKSIYVPFVKWCLLFMLLHNFFWKLNMYNETYPLPYGCSGLYGTKEYLLHTFNIITRMQSVEQLLGGYWFLRSMLYATFAFYITIRIKRRFNFGIIGFMLGYIMAAIILKYFDFNLPFFYIGSREVLATFFILLGYAYKRKNIRLEENKYFVILSVFCVAISSHFFRSDMNKIQYQDYIPFVVTAFLGILMVFGFSKLLSNIKLVSMALTFLGDNTMSVLTWHMLSFKVVSFICVMFYNLPIHKLAEWPDIEIYSAKGWWILYSIGGILLPLIVSKLYQNFSREKS